MVRHDSDLARSRNGPGLDLKSKLQDAAEGEVSVASEREGFCPLGQDAVRDAPVASVLKFGSPS